MALVLRIVASIAILIALQPAIMAADKYDPVGRWEVTTGESRYDVVYCGEDRQICAVLVWLREDQRTAENLALLHKYIVRHARPDGTQSWSGEVNLAGNTYAGTMRMLSRDLMLVQSCSGMLCQTFELSRR
jgi:uncharacterized protein (DUF2147 family)